MQEKMNAPKYIIENEMLMQEWFWEKNNELGLFPDRITAGSNTTIWWRGECGHIWHATAKARTMGSKCPYCARRKVLFGFNDLATLKPDIAKEWHPTLNGSLLPSEIHANSHTVVWWRCEKGHEWQASPNHRSSKGRSCPYCCHNPKVLKGENDLATHFPSLASEWHPIKNGELKPYHFTSHSSKKVWWLCSKGHEWKTAINHRANGSNCPYCSTSFQTSLPEQIIYYYVHNAYPDSINGYTDLFHDHGMELDIFIPSMSLGIEYDGIAFHQKPYQIDREVKKYTKCKANGITLIRIREDKNNTDQSTSDHLLYTGRDLDNILNSLKQFLPKIKTVSTKENMTAIQSFYLSSKKEKSLLHLNPTLAKEWNYEKNKQMKPDMFTPQSNATVWWKCDNGHEWQATIGDRDRGNGCPYCSNRKILKGYNDLAHKRPDLMKRWDFNKNTFSPDTVFPGSGKKAWWKCQECGHEWLAEISSQNKGHGCPECAKRKQKRK